MHPQRFWNSHRQRGRQGWATVMKRLLRGWATRRPLLRNVWKTQRLQFKQGCVGLTLKERHDTGQPIPKSRRFCIVHCTCEPRNERGKGCRICKIRGGSDLAKNIYIIGGFALSNLQNGRGSLLRAITRYTPLHVVSLRFSYTSYTSYTS